MILMAQIQHCCLHTTLAVKKAVGEWCVCGFSVPVLFVCTCAWGLMCLLCLTCSSFLRGMLSDSEALNENLFLLSHKIEFS